MCCHKHPDNGNGLALAKVDSSPMPPWTLEELREAVKGFADEQSWINGDVVVDFLYYLEKQT